MELHRPRERASQGGAQRGAGPGSGPRAAPWVDQHDWKGQGPRGSTALPPPPDRGSSGLLAAGSGAGGRSTKDLETGSGGTSPVLVPAERQGPPARQPLLAVTGEEAVALFWPRPPFDRGVMRKKSRCRTTSGRFHFLRPLFDTLSSLGSARAAEVQVNGQGRGRNVTVPGHLHRPLSSPFAPGPRPRRLVDALFLEAGMRRSASAAESHREVDCAPTLRPECSGRPGSGATDGCRPEALQILPLAYPT